jgi:hypothetical protein
MSSLKKSLQILGSIAAVSGMVAATAAPARAQAANPCAAKTAKNPCAAKTAKNPCAAKGANPCAAKTGNPCAAKGAMKK